MSSNVRKRSVTIGGAPTTIAMEDAFWHELRRMAEARKQTVPKLIMEIKEMTRDAELSSAVRVFVLQHARQRPAIADKEETIFLPP
jgi:predicted DNA-binding ribbon-helix-helix protein